MNELTDLFTAITDYSKQFEAALIAVGTLSILIYKLYRGLQTLLNEILRSIKEEVAGISKALAVLETKIGFFEGQHAHCSQDRSAIRSEIGILLGQIDLLKEANVHKKQKIELNVREIAILVDRVTKLEGLIR